MASAESKLSTGCDPRDGRIACTPIREFKTGLQPAEVAALADDLAKARRQWVDRTAYGVSGDDRG